MGNVFVKYGIIGAGAAYLGYTAWKEIQKRGTSSSIKPSGTEYSGQLSELMPPFYVRDYFPWDILLLYEDNDRELAIQFKRHIEDDFDDLNIRICLYPDEDPAGKPELQDFDDVYERFRYLFVFATESFKNNYKQRFKNEMCLIDSLECETNRYRVIPVYPTQKQPRILELNVLKGIQYHRYNSDSPDPYYISMITNLIQDGRTKIVKCALSE